MNMLVRVTTKDFSPGKVLKEDLFSRNGIRIKAAGEKVKSIALYERLMTYGLYSKKRIPLFNHTTSNPILILDSLVEAYSFYMDNVKTPSEQFVLFVEAIAYKIQELTNSRVDQVLGYIHTSTEYKYSHYHPIHTACLSGIIGKRMEYSNFHQHTIICAALTANISMRSIQDQLSKQTSALTSIQKKLINQHPIQACDFLSECDLHDTLWLSAVEQHHEKFDGTGYPNNMKGTDITNESQIIAISDRYIATISNRSYSKKLSAKEALKEIFMDVKQPCSNEFNLMIAEHLIKEIGVNPPGTVVRLSSGDFGVVTRRNIRNPYHPKVKLFRNKHKKNYISPMEKCSSDPEFAIKEVLSNTELKGYKISTLWA